MYYNVLYYTKYIINEEIWMCKLIYNAIFPVGLSLFIRLPTGVSMKCSVLYQS